MTKEKTQIKAISILQQSESYRSWPLLLQNKGLNENNWKYKSSNV